MTSLYRQIVKRAWYITRKFKYLWPLGIFAAFLGNGGEYQTLIKQVNNVSYQTDIISVWRDNLNSLLPAMEINLQNLFALIISSVISLAIVCLFLWLIISSVGGVIKGSAMANNDERSSFKELFKAGQKKFWPIFGLNIIAKIIIYGILILILTPLMFATFVGENQIANTIIVLLIFLAFIPLSVIVSLVTKYASAFVMLKGEKCWTAFKNGWRLFSANWLISLEMALVLFFINLVVSLIFVVVSLVIFSPFFFFGVVYTIPSPALFNTLIYIAISLLLLLSLFIGAGLATFQISSWTLLYLRLESGKKAYSKIVRLVATLPEKLKKKPSAE